VKRKHVKRIGATVAAFGLGVGIGIFATRPHDPSEHEAVSLLLELKAPVYCGAGAKPLVALTFDDGPGPYSAQLVDVLRRHGARATFFEIGRKAASHPGLVRAELSAGAVGNHSWSHPDLTQLETAAVTRAGTLHVVHNWSWDPSEFSPPEACAVLDTGERLPANQPITLGQWDVRVLLVANQSPTGA